MWGRCEAMTPSCQRSHHVMSIQDGRPHPFLVLVLARILRTNRQWREGSVDRWGGMVRRAGRLAGRLWLVGWPLRRAREVVPAEVRISRAVASAAWWARSGSTLV